MTLDDFAAARAEAYGLAKTAQGLPDVRRVVELLASIAHDDEVAHGVEDDLRARVLHLVATGHPDSAELAKVALRTAELTFARWTA